MAFGEAFSVGPQDHGHMREGRELGSEGVVDHDLPGRIRDMVIAPDHMCDLQLDIIADDAEVEAPTAIRAADDEVLGIGMVEFEPAIDRVVPRGLPFGHMETDGKRLASGCPCLCLLW